MEGNCSPTRGWRPTPRPVNFDADLLSPDSDDLMVTPPSTEGALRDSEKPSVKRSAPPEQEESASPLLKKGRAEQTIMKRTPQPNLTQTKLTSMIQPPAASSPGPTDSANHQSLLSAGPSLGGPGETLNADFFRRLIGENTATVTAKLDKVTGDLAALSKTVEASKSEVAEIAEEVGRHSTELVEHKALVDGLAERIARLEKGGSVVNNSCKLSHAYLLARRSVRMWPIENSSPQTLWKGVGEFLHKALGIPESDIGPDDIEEVTAIPEPKYAAGNINKEALVTFACPRVRDMVVSSSPNLSNLMDKGVPTAGLRLEIPDELMGQFRLLSRFGTRLRARHGVGTKRHVKFDDLDGSLYMNIKLPGDESWSKITTETARIDMERTARDESTLVLQRIHAKPLPSSRTDKGPRQRLAAPMPPTSAGPTGSRPPQDARVVQGQRPRPAWVPREDRT